MDVDVLVPLQTIKIESEELGLGKSCYGNLLKANEHSRFTHCSWYQLTISILENMSVKVTEGKAEPRCREK